MQRFKSTAIAVSTLLASSAAFAAVNPDAVHLALDSLLVSSSKASVVNAIRTNHKFPTTNAEAHLGEPSSMTTTEISAITVGQNGVLNVYLAPVTGTDHGVVQYVPKLVPSKKIKGKEALAFGCVSPNIPEIAKIAPACSYHPVNAPAAKPADNPVKK